MDVAVLTLNSREISIVVWTILYLVLSVSVPLFRPVAISLGQFLWSARSYILHRRVRRAIYAAALYNLAVVWLLHNVGLWFLSDIKATTLWFLTVVSVAMFRVQKRLGDVPDIRESVKELAAITVVLEFIVEFHTLPLWAEVIATPVILGIVLFYTLLRNDADLKTAKGVARWVLIGYGLVVLANGVYHVWETPGLFFQISTLRDFLLIPVLSALFLPFHFLMSTLVSFEIAIRDLQGLIPNLSLRRYTAFKALRAFFWRTELLKWWMIRFRRNPPEDRNQVDVSIAKVLALANASADPPAVDPSLGWSPYWAGKIFVTEGLQTGWYDELAGREHWFSHSEYLKFGPGIDVNHITYHVYGNEEVARCLKLFLHINEPHDESEALAVFEALAHKLCHQVTSQELPDAIDFKALFRDTVKAQIGDYEVVLNHFSSEWDGRKDYEMRFSVRKPPSTEEEMIWRCSHGAGTSNDELIKSLNGFID